LKSPVSSWLKPAVSVAVLFLLVCLSPSQALDPWNLFSPKKVATMFFALALLQATGSVLARLLGARAGAILTGFLGGLISSTATTAALAKRSKISAEKGSKTETLTFLAATGAMLFEGLALLLSGTTQFHPDLALIFLGPLLLTAGLIYRHAKQMVSRSVVLESRPFEILPLLKLAAFIVAVLALSKLLQKVFGQAGLMVLTFLVSLFEIHGSVIANLQLHESGGVSVSLLGSLLAISIFASYLSKLLLIFSIGSNLLRKDATKITALLLLSLVGSYLIFALVGKAPSLSL
jgi:uncharacterized membrane protein (DUF4010 family)